MLAEEILRIDYDIVLMGFMLFAAFYYRNNKSICYLALILFSFHVLYRCLYDAIYHLPNVRVTWNLSWMLLDFLMFSAVVLKRRFWPDKRDLYILGLSFVYMLTQAMQFVDWNFYGHIVMRDVVRFTTPTINTLLVVVLTQDLLKNLIGKLINLALRTFHLLHKHANKSNQGITRI
ncbi:hypothetical protein [Pleionea sediminis]|uniref:hypothetical protein n=1 Tax=Pleionea sediminis TaxID=2569479 RepID=UPI001184F61A|nr:hypothetical protein [Pleionea sediminis]